MKKSLLSLLIIGFVTMLISCSHYMASKTVVGDSESFPDLTTWQGQLEYAKNPNRPQSRSAVDDIRLVKYKKKGTISQKKEVPDVIDRMFSEKSSIVRYIGIDDFEIVPIGLLNKEARAIGSQDDPLMKTKSELLTLLRTGAGVAELELIELEWDFKGDTYYSLAVAANEYGGIIYDNIGHLIVAEKPDFEVPAARSSITMLKTRSESGDKDKDKDKDEPDPDPDPDPDPGGGSGNPGGGIGGGSLPETISIFFDENNTYNILGVIVAHYSILCKTSFTNRAVSDMGMRADHAHMPGFSSAAQIRTLSGGEIGDSFHKFTYAYGVGTGSFSISFDGGGFAISGGSGGASGVEIHQIRI